MSSSKKLSILIAVGTAIGLALTGCGDGTQIPSAGPDAPVSPSAGAAQGAQNDADVAFAQGMIVHHRQAVEMAELAGSRSQNPQVRDLAARIGAAQAPEIATMTGWLQEWGADVPDQGGMNHGGMGGGMSGMMTPEQMQQLGRASGTAFDRMFLQLMSEHHQGAVEMSQTELNEGADPEAKQLAQMIITTQQGEITEMATLLQQT